MVTLKEQMLSDLDDVFYNTNDFGESVTYTPSGKSPTATVIIPMAEDPSLTDPAVLGDSITIRIRSSFFTDIQAGLEPVRGDSLVWNGETWTVIRTLTGGPSIGEWELEISRSEKRIV